MNLTQAQQAVERARDAYAAENAPASTRETGAGRAGGEDLRAR